MTLHNRVPDIVHLPNCCHWTHNSAINEQFYLIKRILLFLRAQINTHFSCCTLVTVFIHVESTISRPTVFDIEMWVPIHYHLQIVWNNFQITFHPSLIYNSICDLIHICFWDYFCATKYSFACVIFIFLAAIYDCGALGSIIYMHNTSIAFFCSHL